MGGEGTKHVGVTSARVQEGLSLGMHSISLGTCRDSDAKPRVWGLGTWPGKAAHPEDSARIMYLP